MRRTCNSIGSSICISNSRATTEFPGDLHDVFYNGLIRVNQDFREISKIITPQHARVASSICQCSFAGRDIRVKNRYVGGN